MAERVAAGMVRDREVAKDLAQEAFLQAYLSMDRLNQHDRFQSWVHGIVLNVSRGYLRSKRMTDISIESFAGGSHLEGTALGALEPDPEEVAEAQELRQAVRRAVASLSPKNRSATLLFYYQQRSLREIAATLNLSVAAIKSRLHRSREDLEELLSPVLQEAWQPESADKEEFAMTEVTVADLIEERAGLVSMVLLEESHGRYLQLWIGKNDAEVIASSLSPNPPKDTDGRREESGRGGEGATGEIAWVPFGVGRSADGLHRRTGAPMAVCGSCDAGDGERIRSRELSRTGLARVCGDLRLSGGWVADGAVRPGVEWLAAGPRRG